MSQTERIQELLEWLNLSTNRERNVYLAMHLELLTTSYDQPLEVFIALHHDIPNEQQRLRGQQRVRYDARARGGTAGSVQEAYINMFGGLVLPLSERLLEIKHLLAALVHSRQTERMKAMAKILLKNAIEYAQGEENLAPEILGELRFQLGKAFSQDLPGQSGQHLVAVTMYYEEALEVYTPRRYPLQYAKVQTALGDAYRCVQHDEPREYLMQAVRCYEAALQAYALPFSSAKP